MKAIQTIVFGKIIIKYRIPKYIDDFNEKYERVKSHLDSYGPKLAGRIDSELDLLPIFEKTEAFKEITKCMDDYINKQIKYDLIPPGNKHLEILSCWMNDMKEYEYNPPHTHHDLTGYSVVLFLKVPTFVPTASLPHKFRDGQIGFIGIDGKGTAWKIPKVGDFYIFQADHQHCVMPFKTKKPTDIRRSMSFNFIIKNPEKNE
jgi:hypothetical protein